MTAKYLCCVREHLQRNISCCWDNIQWNSCDSTNFPKFTKTNKTSKQTPKNLKPWNNTHTNPLKSYRALEIKRRICKFDVLFLGEFFVVKIISGSRWVLISSKSVMLTFLFYWKIRGEMQQFFILFSYRINIVKPSKEVELFDLKGPKQDFLNKGILFYHFILFVIKFNCNVSVHYI